MDLMRGSGGSAGASSLDGGGAWVTAGLRSVEGGGLIWWPAAADPGPTAMGAARGDEEDEGRSCTGYFLLLLSAESLNYNHPRSKVVLSTVKLLPSGLHA